MKPSILLKGMIAICLSAFIYPQSNFAQTTIFPASTTWKYLDNNTTPTGWPASYSTSGWSSGAAPLGYSNGVTTTVSYGPNPNNKYTTTYFNKVVNIPDVSVYGSFTFNLVRDDGAIIYVNGVEVIRSNMPNTPSITKSTFAKDVIGGADETAVHTYTIAAQYFVNGNNTISLELHQADLTSSDLSFSVEMLGNPAPPLTKTYINYSENWKFLDDGTDQGTAWRAKTFSDGSWKIGNSQLGYNDAKTETCVASGGGGSICAPTGNKYITTYFRKAITIANPSVYKNFTLHVYRDDGIVVYVNGTEVVRDYMPTGTINYNTGATTYVPDDGQDEQTFTIAASYFSAGTNVVAVEVHQNNATSSDLVFNAELIANVPTTMINYGATWKYLDNGSNQGTAWQASGFNDVSWKSGAGKFGYGDPVNTIVFSGCGTSNYPSPETASPSCGTKYITTYFRKTINITGLINYASFTFNVIRDDGYVIYVNGIEVSRDNMPGGTINYTTQASTGLGGSAETTPVSFDLSVCSGILVEGNNTIAVEMHQNSGGSSDLGFDLELVGNAGGATGTPSLTRGPYLQVGSETGMTFRWRTNTICYGQVKVGLSNGSYLTASADESCPTTEHIVRVNGLTADTKYFYQIGATDGTILQGDANNFFRTNPLENTTRKIRIVAFGDCGRGDVSRQEDNLNNYQSYLSANGIDAPDAWLLLGDNAYYQGTDAQYTTNFFDIYGSTILKNHKLYPAPGNHDYANSSSNKASRSMPYHQNFSVPQNGEAGGVASNHQNFYSYNVGNIHFISIDSYGTESDGTSIQTSGSSLLKTWIDADLAANTSKWTVAYWHHPPYTKGSHNSDSEGDLVNIRNNFIGYLEARGVDMIICGHTHVYERGYLIKNYTGNWSSFSGANAVSMSSGKYTSSSDCPYVYNSTPANHGTVYVVEGSTGASGGTNSGFASGPMPYAVNDGGVFYFEVEDNRLDAKMLRRNGTIFDQFTIIKDANKTTNYNIANGASQILTASWPKTGNYTWTNTSGTTRSVSVTPPANTTTNYSVTDEYGCVTDQFSVTTSILLPVSITHYNVVLENKKVHVSWSTSSEVNNDFFTVERSSNGVDFTAIGTIDGAGNSTETKFYNFIDDDPMLGTSYYRLSQTDLDAHTKYHGVKRIDNTDDRSYVVKVLTGNNGELVLQINAAKADNYRVKVIDLNGRIVSDQQLHFSSGISTHHISLLPGMYIWEVSNSKREKINEKVIIH